MDGWQFVFRPKRFYARMRQNYGELVTLDTSEASLVMAITPKAAREVLTSKPNDYDAWQKKAFSGLVEGGSLWVLDGARHHRERRLVMPPFHGQRFRRYANQFRKIALEHSDKWQPGQRNPAHDAMLDISRDVILRVVFGLEDGPPFMEGRRVLNEVLRAVHPFLAFSAVFQSCWYPPWRRLKKAKERLTRFVNRCLAERRAQGIDSTDLLGTLMAAQSTDGTSMSDEEIRDELMTILLAGHETTAVALAWAMYELARHSAERGRLQEELDSLGAGAEPESVVKLEYLNAVCDETRRLHTILTKVARLCNSPVELNGCRVPEGVGVGVGICAIHQDSSLYPDPDEFQPKRFIEGSYSPFEFLPFGGGHRRYIGAAFSDYEMRVVLATIVAGWNFGPGGVDRDARRNIGMGPARGAPILVESSRPQ